VCIEKRLAAQALGAERKEKFQQKFIPVSSRYTLMILLILKQSQTPKL
jgi:hypothetical protein